MIFLYIYLIWVAIGLIVFAIGIHNAPIINEEDSNNELQTIL